MRKAIHQFLDLLYPNYCLACETKLVSEEQHVCLSCYQEGLHTVGMKLDNKIGVEQKFEEIHVLLNYWKDGVGNHLMKGLKYHGKHQIGTYLGEQLGRKIMAESTAKIDFLIPIPLHKKKRRFRGYNQAEVIANGLSESLNIPVLSDVVTKVKSTRSQTSKGRKSRMEDTLDTYRLNPSIDLKGKHVMIVDDVVTTGATAEACALAIAPLNPSQISIAALCETKW
jgi:ComF family protein